MLYDYYYFDGIYGQSEIKSIVDIAEKNVEQKYVDRISNSNKNVNTIVVETKQFGDLLDIFFQSVYQTNEDFYGFKIFKDYPRAVNINFYSGDTNEYEYHIDRNILGGASDIKLTAILNISRKPYSGGDLILFTGKECPITQLKDSGNMVVFPSTLYHRVSPVEFGERITLSAWFTGPNWR